MLTTGEKIRMLGSVGIFAGMPGRVLEKVADLLHEEEVDPGQVIVNKGEMGTSMYIIADGSVRVHEGPRTLNALGEGEVFGEMALLDSAPRSATVTAVSPTRLFRLEQRDLYSLMSEELEVARGIIRVLSGHLRARVNDLSKVHDRKEEIEKELEIGRRIQAGFLPDSLPPTPGWEIGGVFHPAREVAGDFYDAFPLSNGRLLGFIVADVSGKGVGAALFMALIRSLIRAFAEQNFSPGPRKMVTGGLMPDAADAYSEFEFDMPVEPPRLTGSALANAVVRTVADTSNYIATVHTKASMFATLFFAVLDLESGLLSYVNGGQEPPVMIDPARKITRLPTTGPAAGLLPYMKFRLEQRHLEPGDTLVVYTDGVTDAMNPGGDFFGEDRLLTLLDHSYDAVGSLLAGIEHALFEHIAGANQFDDITVVALRRLHPGG